MKNSSKIYNYKNLSNVATKIYDDLSPNEICVVLLYAFNRTGKTRLSMAFKDKGKKKKSPDTLYYNAFTEDLFTWHNDLEHDIDRHLKINEQSNFFSGFKGLALEEKIHSHLERYAEFDFHIDYDEWKVVFSRNVANPKYNPKNPNNVEPEKIKVNNIKISRGEENIFIFSVFMAICELVTEGHEAYKWVEYIYIDDPISSLDENNAITIATDLCGLIKKDIEGNGKNKKKYVISSHHSLFYNVVYNELRKVKSKTYMLYRTQNETFRLQANDDTPFFHHIDDLCRLKACVEKYRSTEHLDEKILQSNILKAHHFNTMRAIFEKTAIFFGRDDFSYCIDGFEDKELYARAVNIMSHGKYSIYAPKGMMRENAELFVKLFDLFVDKYKFDLPDVFMNN